MTERKDDAPPADPAAWMEAWGKLARQGAEAMARTMPGAMPGAALPGAVVPGSGPAQIKTVGGELDPFGVGALMLQLGAKLAAEPARLAEAQLGLWRDYARLLDQASRRARGEAVDPLVAAPRDDRRFRDKEWQENAVFDFVRQSYLLTAQWAQDQVSQVEGLSEEERRRAAFYTRQFVDALSPSNFPLTNPEVLRATVESKGENLIKGLENLTRDLAKGHLSMTQEGAFEVGGNLATTAGRVVYQNALMQLIQYAPTTDKVAKRPLLIVPPWINKYYILDMKPATSFVKWAVDQGLTVFMISWVNPGAEHAETGFEDYMEQGVFAALEAIEAATGERTLDAIGYCIGGTLLGATLAYMAAKGDTRIASATQFVAMLDFEDPGEVAVFIDDQQLDQLDQQMKAKGYLEAAALHTTFNMLRANDLIWSFMVNNYLLGKEPFPFDLLYWNGDSTNMPAAMHSFYLRQMYRHNRLKDPGGITLKGVPIDLSKVTVPTFAVAAKEDHIAPWRTVYQTTRLFSGPVTFCLAQSGHIAGVVNPPVSGKYGYWKAKRREVEGADAETWLAKAKEQKGSWWPEWRKWLAKRDDRTVPARHPAEGIEPAPGRYVKVRAI